MDTENGINALKDKNLFKDIVEHRKKYNPVMGIDYAKHNFTDIDFFPPTFINGYENDYAKMKVSMIYGNSLSIYKRIDIIVELRQ